MPFWCSIRLLILIVLMKMLSHQISATKHNLETQVNFESEIHLIIARPYFFWRNYKSKNDKTSINSPCLIKDWIAYLSDDWKVSITLCNRILDTRWLPYRVTRSIHFGRKITDECLQKQCTIKSVQSEWWRVYRKVLCTNFLKAVFDKFYLVHSWILCPK